MPVEDDMTFVDGLCNYRPQGRVSLVVGVEMITSAITCCRERKISKLLVDVTELTGYPNPTLADRFWMVQDWAHAAEGELIVALVTLAEYIHPGKFGVKAAHDAGLKSDVFASVVDAKAWLMANETNQAVRATLDPQSRLQ